MRAVLPGPVRIIGAGAQALAWVRNLKDSGVAAIQYVRRPRAAKRCAGVPVRHLRQLAADIKKSKSKQALAMLVPEEAHLEILRRYVPADQPIFLVFAHGYTPTYEQLPPRAEPVLCAPKLIGAKVRSRYIARTPIPFCVFGRRPRTDHLARTLAIALGATRASLIRVDFRQEVVADLFSEQMLLCGGLPVLVETAYRVLVSKGIPPKVAWAEILFELKMMVDLYVERGIASVLQSVSPKAAFGAHLYFKQYQGLTSRMAARLWRDIHSGRFHQKASKKTAPAIRKALLSLRKRVSGDKSSIEHFYRAHSRWIKGMCP